MPKSHSPYAAEFRQQMVELVRAGRNPNALAGEFGEPAEGAVGAEDDFGGEEEFAAARREAGEPVRADADHGNFGGHLSVVCCGL